MAKRKSSGGSNAGYLLLGLIGVCASAAAYFAFATQMEDVVVATANITANTQISSDMLAVKKVDKSALPPKYLKSSDANAMVGLYTNIGITEGSIFTEGNVATKDTKKSAVIPEGQTLLAISISSLPKGVSPGDRVNILVGISTDEGRIVITYQNVQVTSTKVNEKGDVTGLEVQVTPDQAQKIQYAQLNGELAVSLLPLGYTEEQLNPVSESDAKNYDSYMEDNSVSEPVQNEEESEEKEAPNIDELFKNN